MSSTASANIASTRRTACKTGNRVTQAGPLTIIYPKGGDYKMETAHQRHVREVCERLAAAHADDVKPALQPKPVREETYCLTLRGVKRQVSGKPRIHRLATSVADAADALQAFGNAVAVAVQAAQAVTAPVPKRKPKVARMAVAVAIKVAPVKRGRNHAAKVRDARYQWLKAHCKAVLHARGLGDLVMTRGNFWTASNSNVFCYCGGHGDNALAALEDLWAQLQP